MTYDYCEHCGACVPIGQLGAVRTAVATHVSPTETAQWCERCRQPEPQWDDDHERAAARARSNDFARTNGKDWT